MSPKTFARGTHSNMFNFRNIIMKGVRVPPPPRPPALARTVMDIMTITPIMSNVVGGIGRVDIGKIGGGNNTSDERAVLFSMISLY